MTTFDKREEAFESRFAHDEALEFKAVVRRNRKLAHWVAGLLGLGEEAAAAYAETLMAGAVAGDTPGALAARIGEDLRAGGIAMSDHQIHRELDTFLREARQEVRTG